MAAESGHAANRVYIAQDGSLHMNGAAVYNADENDISAQLNVLDTTVAAELAFIDGVTAGTALASKAVVLSSGGDVTWVDGGDVALGTSTGTKIGTATTQKLGFWNATPVVQPAAAGQAAVSAPTAYSAHASGATPVTSNAATDLDTTAAALATLRNEVNSLTTLVLAIRTALVNSGIIKGAA